MSAVIGLHLLLHLQKAYLAVIGGLVTSTLLTLLVVPVVHTFIDDLEKFVFRFGLNTLKAREDE